MGLELRMKKLLGSGDDDPPAAMAEAESRGLRPSWARLWGRHPIVPPSSPAVAAVEPARAPVGSWRRADPGG